MSCLLTWSPVSTPPPPYDLWEPLLFLCNYVSFRYSLFPPPINILFIRQNVIYWPKNVKQNSMFLIFPSIVLKTVPQYCKSQWCAQLCSVVQNLLSSAPKCKTFARCTYQALSALCWRDWKNLAKTWSQMQERKMRVISRRPILSWSSLLFQAWLPIIWERLQRSRLPALASEGGKWLSAAGFPFIPTLSASPRILAWESRDALVALSPKQP